MAKVAFVKQELDAGNIPIEFSIHAVEYIRKIRKSLPLEDGLEQLNLSCIDVFSNLKLTLYPTTLDRDLRQC